MDKNKKWQFKGMLPILPAVVDNNDNVDVKSEKKLVEYCLSNEAQAIGHLAWASEFAKLTVDDRKIITETLVEAAAKRVPVFIGVTAASSRIAEKYAVQAYKQGADIIMAALPYANIPTRNEAYDFYRRLSESVPIPIIVQDVAVGKVVLDVDLLLELHNTFKNICYIKAEDNDFLPKTAELLKICDDSVVIGGYGGKHMLHMLRLGIKSFMTGTEALDIHNRIVKLYLNGKTEEAAKDYYARLLPYFVFYEKFGEELLKKMLFWRKIIDFDGALTPKQKPVMTGIEIDEFKWVLDRIGFFEHNDVNCAKSN